MYFITEEGDCQEKKTAITPSSFDKLSSLYDIKSAYIFPAIYDIHSHLRVPGQEHKEDLYSADQAACHGGYTAVSNMANTRPPLTDPVLYEELVNRCKKLNVSIIPIAGLTKDLLGKQLVNFSKFIKYGCSIFSDDGFTVMDKGIMKDALCASSDLDFKIMTHCDDYSISGEGIVDQNISAQLGVSGIPAKSEYSIIERDLLLADKTGGHLHVTHISCAESINLIREAKKSNINVSCDVTPHHIILIANDIPDTSSVNYIMAPPLRAAADQDEIIKALIDGTIDAIATDHAPHTDLEKGNNIKNTVNGIIGLETAFPALYTFFINRMNQKQLFKLLYSKLISFSSSFLKYSDPESFFVFTPAKNRLNADFFRSKSKNSPWLDKELDCKIIYSNIKGYETIYE